MLRHHDACEANELNYRARSDKQHLTNFSFFLLFFFITNRTLMTSGLLSFIDELLAVNTCMFVIFNLNILV